MGTKCLECDTVNPADPNLPEVQDAKKRRAWAEE